MWLLETLLVVLARGGICWNGSILCFTRDQLETPQNFFVRCHVNLGCRHSCENTKSPSPENLDFSRFGRQGDRWRGGNRRFLRRRYTVQATATFQLTYEIGYATSIEIAAAMRWGRGREEVEELEMRVQISPIHLRNHSKVNFKI